MDKMSVSRETYEVLRTMGTPWHQVIVIMDYVEVLEEDGSTTIIKNRNGDL